MPPADPKFTVQSGNIAYAVWEGGAIIKAISSLTTDGDIFEVKSRSRKLFACCCSKQQIFGLFSTYIAVVDINDLTQSNGVSTAWKKLVDVPSQTPEFSHLSIVEIFDNIFFFAFEHELEEHDVQVCRVYSITRNKWYNLDYRFRLMPSSIIGYHTTTKSGNTLILTAAAEDNETKKTEFTITYIYTDDDPADTIIKRVSVPGIHQTLFAHKATSVNRKLFISGGLITSRMGYSHNNRIYIFDLESEEITGHIVMSDGRCFHHCMVISDTFVIMGGQLNKAADPQADLFVALTQ
mmetsp:Transcript_6500/g.8022  ORF Transcript_6500/g.8022 Transcript_6500/m.8022 type:complete len:294 (-) Transcript_6500:21-902(-)